MRAHDYDGRQRLVIRRQILLESSMLFECQPLGIGPVPSVPARLLRQLEAIGAGVERKGLAGRGAVNAARVDSHRVGHFMGREGDRVVLYAALIAKHHPVIVRVLSRESSARVPRAASDRLRVEVDQNEVAVGQRSTGTTRTGTRAVCLTSSPA